MITVNLGHRHAHSPINRARKMAAMAGQVIYPFLFAKRVKESVSYATCMKALKHKTKTQGRLTNVQKGMVAEIRRLYRRGEPLNISAVKRNHPKLIQRVYSIKPFWGWKCAMDAAGIDYATIKMEFEEYIICEICGKEYSSLCGHFKSHGTNLSDYQMDYPDAPGVSEAMRVEVTAKLRRRVKGKARKLFPHWEPYWEPLWTPEYALDRLWALYQRGASLNCTSMGLLGEYSFRSRVYQYFDSWDEGLRRIGLDPHDIRRKAKPFSRKYPSADSVIQAIKRRQRRKLPLSLSVLRQPADKDNTLYQSAWSFFGSWRAAIEAAGLDYESVKRSKRKYRTSTDVLRAIRKRKRQKRPLNAGVVNGRTSYADRTLYQSAVREFGSWKKAIHAVGLDYQKIDRSHKGGPPRKYPLPQDVLKEIRRRQRLRLPLNSGVVNGRTDARRDRALYTSAVREFDSWCAAIEKAGVRYEDIAPKWGKYPTPDAVSKEIRRRKRLKRSLGGGAVQTEDKALYLSALRKCGNWKTAVKEAVGKEP